MERRRGSNRYEMDEEWKVVGQDYIPTGVCTVMEEQHRVANSSAQKYYGNGKYASTLLTLFKTTGDLQDCAIYLGVKLT